MVQRDVEESNARTEERERGAGEARISTRGEHQFFGYYDLQPWNSDQSLHLSMRVPFYDRLPNVDDLAEIGVIDRDRRFRPVAETTAWNFQQGAMAQWDPRSPRDTILYNARVTSDPDQPYRAVRLNIDTGEHDEISRPTATVDPSGRRALSVNFARVFDFRAGYGYAGPPDPWKDTVHPGDDGVYLIDLITGTSRLILSYRDIAAYPTEVPDARDGKLVVNHITFNTDGSRFAFICRNFPEPGRRWASALFTADADGGNLYCLNDYGYVSHYHWRDPDHILVHADGNGGSHELYLYTDRTDAIEPVDTAFFTADGHCSYSPDRSRILYDSYPGPDGYRYLYVYDVAQQAGKTLGRFYSDPKSTRDIRCDLHPRWNRHGDTISFDSTHEGFRGVYTMDLG